jgi:hypothetical protein
MSNYAHISAATAAAAAVGLLASCFNATSIHCWYGLDPGDEHCHIASHNYSFEGDTTAVCQRVIAEYE